MIFPLVKAALNGRKDYQRLDYSNSHMHGLLYENSALLELSNDQKLVATDMLSGENMRMHEIIK